MRVLAADVGRTRFRAAVVTGGSRGLSVQLDNGATLADQQGVARLTDLLRSARRAIGASADDVDAIVVAAAGAMFRPDQAQALLDALATPAETADDIVVTTDIIAAHAGALDGRPGAILAAGTGAVAFAVNSHGETTLVDGAGYLLGDAGSGFTVGRAGLAAALRHHDGRRGGSAELARLAVELFGELGALPGRVHGDTAPARTVASFAPAVAAAARAGDDVAAAIWRRAVDDLVETAVAACAALPEGERRLAVSGSLFDLADLVNDPFAAALAAADPAIEVRRAGGDAVIGAARMAEAPAGVYEDSLLRRSTVLGDRRM